MKVSDALFHMKLGDISGKIMFVCRELIEEVMVNFGSKPTGGYNES